MLGLSVPDIQHLYAICVFEPTGSNYTWQHFKMKYKNIVPTGIIYLQRWCLVVSGDGVSHSRWAPDCPVMFKKKNQTKPKKNSFLPSISSKWLEFFCAWGLSSECSNTWIFHPTRSTTAGKKKRPLLTVSDTDAEQRSSKVEWIVGGKRLNAGCSCNCNNRYFWLWVLMG